MKSAQEDQFRAQIDEILPRLRTYALSLTRDPDTANDLVHDTIVKALTGLHGFETGSNMAAWLFRIQRNVFVSGLRRRKPTVPMDAAVAESLSHPPHQDSGITIREFMHAFRKLAPTQQEALTMAVLDGFAYDVIAIKTGVSIGTVKSRISRARLTLQRLFELGPEREKQPRWEETRDEKAAQPAEEPAPPAKPTPRRDAAATQLAIFFGLEAPEAKSIPSRESRTPKISRTL